MSKYEDKILNLINASTDHMTSEEVFFKLKEEEPKVVLATIYNNLNRLYENDKIIKLSIPGQPDRYDKKIRHDHIICSKCGEIDDFTFSDLTSGIESKLGDDIMSYDLKIMYICPKCKSKS